MSPGFAKSIESLSTRPQTRGIVGYYPIPVKSTASLTITLLKKYVKVWAASGCRPLHASASAPAKAMRCNLLPSLVYELPRSVTFYRNNDKMRFL
jgi:hypothetical protein